MTYKSEFFQTKEEAKAFQQERGYGVLYSCAKGSRTKQKYYCEAAMRGLDMAFCETYPYVVTWNEP